MIQIIGGLFSLFPVKQKIRKVMIGIFLLSGNLLFAMENHYVSENGYNNCDFFSNGERYCLDQHLNENSRVIVDVGANIGEWTLMALTYAPIATVHAFEPHPKIYEILSRRTSDRGVECMPFGLSNQEGIATFWVWGGETEIEKSGLNGLFYRPILNWMFNQKPDVIKVPMVTLDDYCERRSINHIDYLKIDTEGNEWFVLLGAKKMLSEHSIDVVQFEYGGCYIDSGTRLESVYHFLRENGFDVFRILPNGVLPISSWDSELENFQYSNYLAILNKEAVLK